MQSKLSKIGKKIVASILVIALTAGNLMLIGSSMVSYAEANLESQNEKTQHENVEFGAYFKSEGKEVHSLICDVNQQGKLYLHLNIKNGGFLKAGRIEWQETNYDVQGELEESEIISKKQENQMELKQINYGTEVEMEIPIGTKQEEVYKVENSNKDSIVVLEGIYVTPEGKEVEIKKEVKLNVAWKGKAEIECNSKITVYKSIEKGEEKGVLLQEKIEIQKANKSLPIRKTEIEVMVPEYAGERPENIRVSSRATEMTNGKREEEVEINWNYEEETGIVRIEVENREDKGVVWSKEGGKDEYQITYEYGQAAYEKQAELEEVEVERKATVKVDTYSHEEESEPQVIETSEKLKEEIGAIISGEIEMKGEINKAKLYASSNREDEGYKTEYEIKEIIPIAKKEYIEGIKWQAGETVFYFEEELEGEKFEQEEKIEEIDNKAIKIKEKNFKDILGEEGYILIRNEAGEEIGRIDKDSKQEEGYYRVEYEEVAKKIEIETSKPEQAGNLILEVEKEMKGDLGYSKEELERFIKIGERATVGEIGEKGIEVEGQAELKEAESYLTIESNKEVINNKKEAIELQVEFGNKEETSILYRNPTVEITLPDFVEEAEVISENLLFDDELEIKESKVKTNEAGEKVIEISLTGTQTKFSALENSNGSTLIVGANIISKDEGGEGTIRATIEKNTASTELTSYWETEEKEQEVIPETVLGQDAPEVDEEEPSWLTEPTMGITLETIEDFVEEGESLFYYITITNLAGVDGRQNINPNNVVVTDVLPQGLRFEDATIEKFDETIMAMKDVTDGVSYDEETRTVTWKIGDMVFDFVNMKVKVSLDTFANGVYQKEIVNQVMATYDGGKVASNEVKTTIGRAGLNVRKQSEGIQETNQTGDIVKFILKAENIGAVAEEVNFEMTIPEEMEPMDYTRGKGEELVSMSQRERTITEHITLEAGEIYTFQITARVGEFEGSNRSTKVLATVNGEETSWELHLKEADNNSEQPSTPSNPENPGQPSNPANPENPSNPSNQNPSKPTEQEKRYTVSGLVWADENKNGLKEEGEGLLIGIRVKLVNINTNRTVQEVTTNNKGEYRFAEVEKGQYQIIFVYNGTKYQVTAYRKTGELQVNSSAIAGEEVGEALTDVITVTNANITNINLGLIDIPKFDMRLKKEVSRIIVQNQEGTKEYKVQGDLARTDINGKYLKGTVVLIEYKIRVTNEGELTGKVKSIVDYMPKELTFSSELNRTWTEENGKLYNRELKDIEIATGESKEITLILRKTMTEGSTGLITNIAEIAEVENQEKIQDEDSSPNNKRQGEDDMSSADVLLGVKTGTEVIYATLGIVIFIILGVGIYFINQKVLKK